MAAKPHRRFEMTLTMEADSFEELLSAMDNLHLELTMQADKENGHMENRGHSAISGGFSSGYTLDIRLDPDVTHDTWAESLNAYLEATKAAKRQAKADDEKKARITALCLEKGFGVGADPLELSYQEFVKGWVFGSKYIGRDLDAALAAAESL